MTPICDICGNYMDFDDHIDTTDVPTKLYHCPDCDTYAYAEAEDITMDELPYAGSDDAIIEGILGE